jgi:hypothetical protein
MKNASAILPRGSPGDHDDGDRVFSKQTGGSQRSLDSFGAHSQAGAKKGSKRSVTTQEAFNDPQPGRDGLGIANTASGVGQNFNKQLWNSGDGGESDGEDSDPNRPEHEAIDMP